MKMMFPEREFKIWDIEEQWVFLLFGILLVNSACVPLLNPLYYDEPKVPDSTMD